MRQHGRCIGFARSAMTFKFLFGDVRKQLRTLAADSFHCCVTIPHYWGLRDYGVDGQIGLEPSRRRPNLSPSWSPFSKRCAASCAPMTPAGSIWETATQPVLVVSAIAQVAGRKDNRHGDSPADA